MTAFNSFAKKYKDFLVPAFQVKVKDCNIFDVGSNQVITGISVDTSVEKADSFSFTLSNVFDPARQEFTQLDNLDIGQQIQIDMGYADVLKPLFHGYITSVRYELTSWEQTSVVVSGMGNSFKLMKGIKSRAFSQLKDGEVAQQIISRAGLTANVDKTEVKHDMIQQVGISDYQFLCYLAERNGYEFFITGKKAYFRRPHQDKYPVVTLTWGKDLLSLYKEDDLSDQAGIVKVRSWDLKNKVALTGQAGSINKVDSGDDGTTILKKALGTVEDNYFSEARSPQQVNIEADAIQNRSAMKLVSGEATCIGIPEIRAGKYVELAGLGPKLNKVYYITSARHNIDESGYTTTLTIGGNVV